ncbi:MAG: hypothetical protein LC725_04310, partial [Lentisphaerae bacterium]|nr:hypothetical protein [Lentisphaerota bacterium]
GPLFRWRSPDGSSILAFRCGSDGANAYSQQVGKDIYDFGHQLDKMPHDMMMLYGVSNHGGAPTKQAIADIKAAAADAGKSFDVAFSAAESFSAAQDPDSLPVFQGELMVRAYGVFVNHTEVKRNNRLGEYALANAEKFALLAECLAGRPYPRDKLTAAWQDLLFNQFHDIIGGASVEAAYSDARDLHGRARQSAAETLHYSLQTMACDIDTDVAGFPLVVWNPNAFDLTAGIEAELQWAWEFPWYAGDLKVTDPEGRVLPCQIIQEKSALPRFRSRFVFHDTIPSLGYHVYTVTQESQPMVPSDFPTSKTTQLASRRFLVDINPQTGCIASVFDNLLDREVMQAAGLPRVLEDQGDTWAFNTTEGYGADLGGFQLESMQLVEQGPVRTLLRTRLRCNDSTMEQDLILYHESDVIEGRFRVHWREKRRVLKLYFDACVNDPAVTAGIPYGAIARPADGREQPAGEWLDLGAGDWGVALLTDSVFGYDVRDARVGLTLLRAPIHAHYGHPDISHQIDPAGDYVHLEQGVRSGIWQILPHAGDWRKAQTPRRAMGLNNPVITLDEGAHPGSRPRAASFLQVRAESTLVTVMKKAEEGDDIVLRLVEYAGQAGRVELRLPAIGAEFDMTIKPHAIMTLRLESHKGYQPRVVNILEE